MPAARVAEEPVPDVGIDDDIVANPLALEPLANRIHLDLGNVGVVGSEYAEDAALDPAGAVERARFLVAGSSGRDASAVEAGRGGDR